MLVGGDKSKTSELKSQYQALGWTVVNKDLNAGAGGDYIYLLYKPEADTDTGSDRDYVTGFYIKSGSSGVTDTLVSGGKTYTLTPYDGDNHFKSQKGDLNSGTGDGSASIHLYYTKAVAGGKAVSGIVFNDEQNVIQFPYSCNLDFKCYTKTNWLACEAKDGIIAIAALPNETGHIRSGYVYYEAGTTKDSIFVQQCELEKKIAELEGKQA